MKISAAAVIFVVLVTVPAAVFAQDPEAFIEEELTPAKKADLHEQIEDLKKNYLAVSEQLFQLRAQNEKFRESDSNTQARLEATLKSLSEVTVENQLLKSEMERQAKQQVSAAETECQAKIGELEGIIETLKEKFQKVEKLIGK